MSVWRKSVRGLRPRISDPVEAQPERVPGSTEAMADASKLHRKRRGLQFTALVAVVITTASLLAAGWIRSPQQRRAETAPPARTNLTAAVERRVLKDTVILRGQVGAGATIEITPTPGENGRAVVTGIRKRAGDEFSSGTVLLEVAGRPLIALPGSIPAYRDIRPGSEGKDVAQLQRALRSLGHASTDRSGTFGRSTKRALEQFYQDLGYETATTGEEDARAVAAGADAVRKAERALSEAIEERDRIKATAGASEDLRNAERRVRYSREDLAQAKLDLATLESQSGPMLPLSEVVFLSSFPARVVKLSGGVGQEVKAPLITLSAGSLVVSAKLNPAQRSLLDENMAVTVSSELTGDNFMGTVASIGGLRQDESGGRSHELVVRTKKALPSTMVGADVRLTVEAASTGGEVLVVPVSALYASADGQTAVQRQLPEGGSERVVVTVGVTGGGYAAVTPVSGRLSPEDQVILGEGPK